MEVGLNWVIRYAAIVMAPGMVGRRLMAFWFGLVRGAGFLGASGTDELAKGEGLAVE